MLLGISVMNTLIFIHLYIFKILFTIYWKGRFADRRRDRRLPSEGSLPKWLKCLELSQELLWVFPPGCRGPRLWLILPAFPNHQQGVASEVDQPGHKLVLLLDAGPCSWGLAVETMHQPTRIFFSLI